VADVQSIIEQVRAAGYTVVSEPHHGAGSPLTIAMAKDAEGTLIEFFELSTAHYTRARPRTQEFPVFNIIYIMRNQDEYGPTRSDYIWTTN